MGMPYYTTNNWDKARPFKYGLQGDEVSKSIVVDNDTVHLSPQSQRLVTGGSLLCEITATGLFGPYDKAAGDGRESLTKGKCVITGRGLDVTLYDRAVAGYFADCVFDLSELTLNGVSAHGASLTALEAALPQCTFDD